MLLCSRCLTSVSKNDSSTVLFVWSVGFVEAACPSGVRARGQLLRIQDSTYQSCRGLHLSFYLRAFALEVRRPRSVEYQDDGSYDEQEMNQARTTTNAKAEP